MLLEIATLEDLYKEAVEIQKFLDVTMSEDATEATMRGNDLATYLSRTAKMLADAKHHYNERMKSDLMESLVDIANRTPHATATAVNQLVKSLCRDEQFMVDWLERMNNTVGKQLEWCRTVISKAKAEMTLAGYQRT